MFVPPLNEPGCCMYVYRAYVASVLTSAADADARDDEWLCTCTDAARDLSAERWG